MKRIIFFLAVMLSAFLLILGVSGCNQSVPSGEQVVRAAVGFDDVDTLDPHYMKIAPSMTVCHTIYNKLVRFPEGTYDVENAEGDLAESWEFSPDRLAVTFKLRQGVQWQKGFGEVTAEDVKFSLERILADPAASSWYYLRKVARVEAPDRYTVVVRFTAPDPLFIETMCYTTSAIVPQAAALKYGKDFRTNPVGSGPFELESYIPKEKVTVTAHHNYFRGKPHVGKIEFLFILDKNAAMNAFLSKTVDVTDWKGEHKLMYDAVAKSKDGLIIDRFQGALFFIFLDTANAPTSDIRVRKAIAHAIDVETYVQMMEPTPGAWHRPSFGVLCQGILGYTEEGVTRYEYDPEKARQLLAEAGYPQGLVIRGYCHTTPFFKLPVTYVQDQLAKVGIKYELTMTDYPTFAEKLKNGECRPLTWEVTYPNKDPLSRFVRLFTKGGENFVYTGYDQLESLILPLQNEFDLEKRKAVYMEIQRALSRDVVAVPIQCVLPIMARWPYIDLGYEARENQVYYYEFNEKLRVLK